MTEEEARRFFSAGYTLVLTGGGVITDRRRGISPLYDVYRSGRDVVGWSAADRIVGKAAAMLYVLLGVGEVHAEVMSEDALVLLAEHGIRAECEVRSRMIKNRAGTDYCPMEKAVGGIADPAAAACAIAAKLDELGRERQ